MKKRFSPLFTRLDIFGQINSNFGIFWQFLTGYRQIGAFWPNFTGNRQIGTFSSNFTGYRQIGAFSPKIVKVKELS